MKRATIIIITIIVALLIVSFAYAVEIPPGMYTVGKDIPAGNYTISYNGNKRAFIEIWSDDERNIFKRFYDDYLKPGSSEKVGKITLEEGNVFQIEEDSLDFSNYDGLDFDFSSTCIVPMGIYFVNDIPAGDYMISTVKNNRSYIQIWPYDERDIFKRLYGDYIEKSSVKIELIEGNMNEIQESALAFEPFGGFNFGSVDIPESASDRVSDDSKESTSESLNNNTQTNGARLSNLYTYSIKGNGTVSIVDYDWKNSSGDIYIPSMLDGYTVTTIGEEAFAKGKDVNKNDVMVIIPDTITMIGEKAFYNSPISAVSIPASVQSIGKAAFAYCDITQFIVDQKQPNYTTVDGVLYDKRNKALLAHPQKRDISGKIPEGILTISEYAFSGMTIGQANTSSLYFTSILPSSLNNPQSPIYYS